MHDCDYVVVGVMEWMAKWHSILFWQFLEVVTSGWAFEYAWNYVGEGKMKGRIASPDKPIKGIDKKFGISLSKE